jgi:hypothetical protein
MTKAFHKRGNSTLYGEQPHTPGDWTLNGDQLIALHTDEDGDHETLIADIFTEHDCWKANARLLRAAPEFLDAILDIKRHAGKSGDHDADPWTLLDLIGDRALAALDRMHKG